ncbi:MAG: DUF262 domain-containing protein [Phycisphaerae bacterium]|nr:DUF262 domain-containing protein [Phycisphaerae bacterium]
MSIAPRGISVQQTYRWFRSNKLLVNRRYQRKLVWTVEEKQRLIDSMLHGYPIPLILLAEVGNDQKYEIIDGIQRLNAVFSFIENAFSVDGRFFDIAQFADARQAASHDLFSPAGDNDQKLDATKCADLLAYEFAVTTYAADSEENINEVFRRVNAQGRQLSNQERRQAGVTTPYADCVRTLGAEIRGDVSSQVLNLSQMPEISVDTRKSRLSYGITAEEVFWCKQGILSTRQLRESDDEDLIADLVASIVLGKPIARSMELLDDIYNADSAISGDVETALAAHGVERLHSNIKAVFSVFRKLIEDVDDKPGALRNAVSEKPVSSIKTEFYTLFMALYELIVNREKSPDDAQGIVRALKGLAQKINKARHYTTEDDRSNNINMVVGLIEPHFVKREPPDLGHGPSMLIDFENSLRRSRIETTRYEMKQGVLRLDDTRSRDEPLMQQIVKTICGIANLGPDSQGYVYLGIADKDSDAERVRALDGVTPLRVGEHLVVGLDREAKLLKIKLEDHIRWITTRIAESRLSDHLRNSVMGRCDTIDYKGLSVLRVTVPSQTKVSYVDRSCFTREDSSTVEVQGPDLESIFARFR